MDVHDRAFKVIAFDWDGTAVMGRQEDAGAVCQRLEELLNRDADIVIITGTNFQNIDRQATGVIVNPHKRQLYVCVNRGSEVYGFDQRSQPVLLYRRTATPQEERLLTSVAERLKRWIEGHDHLQVAIIYNRLNRRKIDLIPVPEWADPPKSAIGDLLKAVEHRLTAGGIAGGIKDVLDVTARIAREVGLDARITSDVKHVEVGLTDKGDSVAWMMQNIVARRGCQASDLLIVGDEFGPIDGFPGSDYKMVHPKAAGAAYASVGKEPNGVPAEVIHLGGGPPQFLALLDAQIRSRDRRREEAAIPIAAPAVPLAARPLAPARPHVSERPITAISEVPEELETPESGWQIVETGFNPGREHEVESLFSVGNGYSGTRGSLSERTAISRPGTFIAGVFDIPARAAVPELVKAPDWARLQVAVEGQELNLENGETLEHTRILDMKHGLLRREWRHKDGVGRVTRLSFVRFASLADHHALVESLTIVPENYGGYIAVESALDAPAGNVAAFERLDFPEHPVLAIRTAGSTVEIAFAMATNFYPSRDGQFEPALAHTDQSVMHRLEWPAEMGKEYRIDKVVSAFTSRDLADPVPAALEHLSQLCDLGVPAMRQAHETAWAERWAWSDVQIEGDNADQRAIRFAVYHLVSAANPCDPRVSIGARGLTGEAYKGHVFWDTETFMLPFFTFTYPTAAQTLLSYRHRTLPAAKERARRMGYRGALYAWESTETGEDVTPSLVMTPSGEVIRILCGDMEHHISADVPYAVWQYWQATADERFLLDYGAEIIIECARFWASRIELEGDGLYHLRRVIGPDEYHEGVDDNAYTNVMAQWCLETAATVVTMLEGRWPEQWRALAGRIGWQGEEVRAWRDMAARTYNGFDPRSGVFEQFAGYFDLEFINPRDFEPRTAPLDVILGRERIQKSQVIKQADVVMLVHLLWDRFPPAVREANFRYYEPRTDHGSSLSPPVHALVAARLGDIGLASRYFKQAAEIDLANNMGNAATGVHMATQGALWQAIVFGFASMGEQSDDLGFEVRLPSRWRSIGFPLTWRARRLRFWARQRPELAEVVLDSGTPLAVRIAGEAKTIEPGKPGGRWPASVANEEVA